METAMVNLIELNEAKLRYSTAYDAYEKAHAAYIQVCDRFETGNADHAAIEAAWVCVIEENAKRRAAYDHLNRVYGGKA
jgi:hypothetical protein